MIDTMLVNPHVSEYIASLEPDLPKHLEELYEDARKREVPVIRREAMSLLRFLLSLRKPKKVLEVGTAIGFSAAFMANCDFELSITTIEKMPEKVLEAREHFVEFGLAERVSVLSGDAEEVLTELAERGETYDFIFLDAAKAQYPVYLKLILRMMDPGAVLVTDNIFQEGSLSDSKFTVTRRNRTIHMRMRDYINDLMASERLSSVVLPVGDGMTASVRKD